MSKPLRRVVLVEDHDLFRAGVRAGLEATVEVVGEAASVADAVPLIKELDPDVVLLDVHLPDGGGQAVIVQVAPERPGVKFLALSVSDAAEDVIGVIRAGARGYVTKAISGGELTEAVHRIADGDAVFSPRLAGFVLDAFRSGNTASTDPELDQLTARERIRQIENNTLKKLEHLPEAQAVERRLDGEVELGDRRNLLVLRLGLLVRRRLVLLALDEVDAALDQVCVEVLDLLLRELDVLEPLDDLVVAEESLLVTVGDELLELFDLGKRDIDGEQRGDLP